MARIFNDVWTCCNCDGPNLIANAPSKCPVCSHQRCSSCIVGRSRHAMSTSNSAVWQARNRSHQHWAIDEFLSVLPRPLTTIVSTPYAGSNNGIPQVNFTVVRREVHSTIDPKVLARPSMRGS
ncbi:hypothetical protein PAAG_04070 [Paracoccidioides lutzii Pb01]|uniref:Uncharacterized protein n=1 Tax=Paracoccidioides lutzii (strain ATCC MYA-826 / Pb01) TaxID=502779 RepID=C1GZX6_PARBA|nr:hypothetical protein PAAG_04070 [Paracoccidioides lutzii Pb01]EEH33017.2 hypothetical protein PAAG_04070 [Paracoccidioides lutzii Pb01]